MEQNEKEINRVDEPESSQQYQHSFRISDFHMLNFIAAMHRVGELNHQNSGGGIEQ
jgi:hypothetical protein